jgi:hypothetical protein
MGVGPVIPRYSQRLVAFGLLFRNLISHALVRRFANRCDGVIVPTCSTHAGDLCHHPGLSRFPGGITL